MQRYDYAPFGRVTRAEGSHESEKQYTGEQWDGDAGLLYLRARWYDPSTGRFLTKDPFPGYAGLPQTQHPYVYCRNDPINLTDPSGEFAFIPLLLVGLAGGVLGGLTYYTIKTLLNPCATWDWGEALFWTGLGGAIGAAIGSLVYGGWWLGVQIGWWAPLVGTPMLKFAIHGAHHVFPLIGSARHIQIMLWLAGVKESHHILRIPIP